MPTIWAENEAFFAILYNAGNNFTPADITVYLKITCVTY
jgi:hypothetical protein